MQMPVTEQTNRLGVNIMEQRVLEAGHIFREQAVSDSGIDAQIEIKDSKTATGRLFAAQIKAGPSYFSNENDSGFSHYVSDRHRDLWISHSLPVILVLCDAEKRAYYYKIVSDEICVQAGERWKILVPKNKTITAASSSEIAVIASPILAASDYSIHAEQDHSDAHTRRVSLDIVAHPGNKSITKPFFGAVVRSAVEQGRNSQYHCDNNRPSSRSSKIPPYSPNNASGAVFPSAWYPRAQCDENSPLHDSTSTYFLPILRALELLHLCIMRSSHLLVHGLY